MAGDLVNYNTLANLDHWVLIRFSLSLSHKHKYLTMKEIIVVVFLLFTNFLYAQKITKSDLENATLENFYVENCNVKWIKVFNAQLSKKEFFNGLLRNQFLEVKNESDSLLSGSFNDIAIVGTRYSYKDFLTGSLSGNFIVEIREGRYRVTISNVKELSSQSKRLLTLEWYALNNECEFKSTYGFTKYIGKMLEIMFTDWFNIDNKANNAW